MNQSPSQSMPPVYRQVRWWILALLFLVTVINFVDRQALAVLGNDITDEFKLSNTDFGTIVSWFRFGMMLGEFPMGFLMDRVGVRDRLGVCRDVVVVRQWDARDFQFDLAFSPFSVLARHRRMRQLFGRQQTRSELVPRA